MPEPIPPLPPGFVLEQPQAGAGMPPLPPGFMLEEEAPAQARPAPAAAAVEPSPAPSSDLRNPEWLQRMGSDQALMEFGYQAIPAATTAGGVAIGSTAGVPGMVLGGAAGASAGARAVQQLRGDPEPTTGEKTKAAVGGAIAGGTGGLLQGGVNALATAFRKTPTTKLSMDMQQRAKAIDAEFRRSAKAAGRELPKTGKRGGFASPEARSLWSRSKLAEELEAALVRARGNPDRVRQAFASIASRNRLMANVPPEVRGLIDDVGQQSTTAGMLRSIGELRNFLDQGLGAGAVRAVAGPLGVGALGRAVDRSALQRLADTALAGVAGVAPPVQPASTGIAALGAGALRPVVDPQAEALAQVLVGKPRSR